MIPAEKAGGASSRGTVVIAEDDAATLMLLTAVLRRAAYTVYGFENGRLAYDAVKRKKPDVILLDWVMPVMDGREAVDLLKSDADTRGIPIVMLTTHSQIEERVEALEAGVQDFLTKPFDPRELVARIDQQIRWRQVLAVDANEAFAAQRLQLYRGKQTHSERTAEGPDFFDKIWGASKPAKHRTSP